MVQREESNFTDFIDLHLPRRGVSEDQVGLPGERVFGLVRAGLVAGSAQRQAIFLQVDAST